MASTANSAAAKIVPGQGRGVTSPLTIDETQVMSEWMLNGGIQSRPPARLAPKVKTR